MSESMINLMNDYNMTAHPRVLEALREADGKRFIGYGADEITDEAADAVRQLTGRTDADVHFMIGGTHTNLTAVSAFLRSHEAVVSPASAHINVHETGAIEVTGHKIITTAPVRGKIIAEEVAAVVRAHTDEHMVRPRMVMISQSSELGTVYTRAELAGLREVCDEFGLILYVDGARLGAALVSGFGDMTIEEFAAFPDVFYIGGTKNGLLFGEALVINNPALRPDFRFHAKQRGGLLAKGFLLGIQFRALLEGGLYFDLARRANEMATLLTGGLKKAGVAFLVETETNQVFLYVDEERLKLLEEKILFERWAGECEKGTPIRFVTSWQTTVEEIEAVLGLFDI